jgi:hypothetical protein
MDKNTAIITHGLLSCLLALAVWNYSAASTERDLLQQRVTTQAFELAGVVRERDNLKLENQLLRTNSGQGAPLGSPRGGILDTLNNGKVAMGIVTGALNVDKATDPATRVRKLEELLTYIAKNTDNVAMDRLSLFFTDASNTPGLQPSLQGLVEVVFQKE